jgi:threonine dehydratase
MGVAIELARQADERLTAAFARLIPQLSSTSAVPDVEALRRIVEFPGNRLLVARDGDEVVGTLTLVLFPIPTGLRARIEDVVVDEAARGRGVVTASAGNHGLGVATAADLTGVPATVVVPETASAAKVDLLRQTGCELVLHGPDYDAAEAHAIRLAEARDAGYVSAYDHPAVVAGGGTIALEILETLPDTDILVVPAGGGGLISGIALAAKALRPEIGVYGAQSTASPALHAALAAGHQVTVPIEDSLADGLAGNIAAGSITVDLAGRHVDAVALVSEAEIAAAMRATLEHEHCLVEGSAAVTVAALSKGALPVRGRRVVLVLTGRNVAPSVLRGVLGLAAG